MKQTVILFLLALISPAQAGLNIVTTTTDFADLAKQIGRDRVTVHSIMKGPENVHNVLATPAEMVKLHQADLFVHGGLDAEPWRDNLLRGARNPKVQPGRPGNVDMSEGITLRDVPEGKVDRSGGDLHAYGNPHYAIHPANAQRMCLTLVRAMADVDAANADFYRANAKELVKDLAAVAEEMKKAMAPYPGLKVVTFHKAWDYFADATGFTIVTTIEPQVAITPSAAQVQQLVERMKREGVKVVICETYDDARLAQSVADKAGAKMVVLPDHVLGVPEADSYQKLFRHNVAKLTEAAKAAGANPLSPEGRAGKAAHAD